MKDIRDSKQFYYTQQSLNAFENCPLKFKKRYMEGLKWDSMPDMESRAALERGRSFHLLAQRYFIGIDTGLTENAEDAATLGNWINSLKKHIEISSGASYHPEYTLRTDSHGMQLEANFDLVVVKGGDITIWDWKTHGINTIDNIEKLENKLRNSFQTMVYMFTMKEKADELTGKGTGLENLTMKYWQPDPPRIAASVKYNDEIHQRFQKTLQDIIKKIKDYAYNCFDKTQYSRYCRYCEFNWYCNR